MLEWLFERLVVKLSPGATDFDAERQRRDVLDEVVSSASPPWRAFLERHAHRLQRGGVPTLLALAEAEPASSEIGAAARAFVHSVARPELVATDGPTRQACVRTIEPLPRVLIEAASAQPGTSVVFAAGWGALMEIDVATGKVRAGDDTHGVSPRWLAVAPGEGPIVSASEDGKVHVWNRATLVPTKTGSVKGDVRGLTLSPDGTRLAAASERGLQLGSASGRDLKTIIKGACAKPAAFDASGTRIAIVVEYDNVRIADVASGRTVATLATSPDGLETVEAVAFHPDGRLLVLTQEELQLWDADRGTQMAALKAPIDGPRAVSGVDRIVIAGDGRTVVTGGASDQLVVWDLEQRVARGAGRTGGIDALGVFALPDGRIATAESDALRVWDLEALSTPSRARREVLGVAFLDDHGVVVVSHGHIGLHAAADLAVIAHAPMPELRVLYDRVSIAVAPDRRHVAVWAGEEVFVYETAGMTLTWQWWTWPDDLERDEMDEDRSITSVAFDGDELVVGTEHERRAHVVRVDGTPVRRTDKPRLSERPDKDERRLPDGKRVLAWEHDVLALREGKGDLARWVASAPIHEVVVSPSGDAIVVATTLGGLELLRWRDGDPALSTIEVPKPPPKVKKKREPDEVDEMFAADMKGLPEDGAERLREIIKRADDALPMQQIQYFKTAQKLVEELAATLPAEQHVELMRELGVALVQSHDDKLAKKGVALLKRAIAAGDLEATYELGFQLDWGYYLDEKPEEAMKLLEQAAARGHGQALHTVGMRHFQADPTRPQALEMVTRAAELGVAWSRTQLADWAVEGVFGPKDPARAFAIYTELAEVESGAAAGLAVLYRHGLGVEKDSKLAKQWYDRAEKAGHDWSDDDRW